MKMQYPSGIIKIKTKKMNYLIVTKPSKTPFKKIDEALLKKELKKIDPEAYFWTTTYPSTAKNIQILTQEKPLHCVIIINNYLLTNGLIKKVNLHKISIISIINSQTKRRYYLKKAKKLAKHHHIIITMRIKDYKYYKKMHSKTYFFGNPHHKTAITFLKFNISYPPHIRIIPENRESVTKTTLPILFKALNQLYLTGHHFQVSCITTSNHHHYCIEKQCQNNLFYCELINKNSITSPLETTLAIMNPNSNYTQQNVPRLIIEKYSLVQYFFQNILRLKKQPKNYFKFKKPQTQIAFDQDLNYSKVSSSTILNAIQHCLYKTSFLKLNNTDINIYNKNENKIFNKYAKLIYNALTLKSIKNNKQ